MLIDICTTSDYDELFFSTLSAIANSGEKLAGNYAHFQKSDYLSFPVIIKDGKVIAFSGLQYDERKWGSKTGRVSSRFWLAAEARRRGLANFQTDENWVWHNAQLLIPHQMQVAIAHGLESVFISRDRKDRRSFSKFVDLVNAYSPAVFQVSERLHDVCSLADPPLECIQLVAWAKLDNNATIPVPSMCHHPLRTALVDPAYVFATQAPKMQVVDAMSLISSEFKALLWDKNLQVGKAQIFTYEPNQTLGLHVDDVVVDNKAKVNQVIGGMGSILEWWEPNCDIVKEVEVSPMGTRYLKYEAHECTLLKSCSPSGTFVMNAGVPHRLINGNAPRICVSVPVFDHTGEQLQFDDLVALLK